jgi:hypothetical protein
VNHIFSTVVAGFIICTFVVFLDREEPDSALFKVLAGTTEAADISGSIAMKKSQAKKQGVENAMQIIVKANGNITMFELNNSPAARDLYAQLPLSISVENYSNNEKIFYPPEKLKTTGTPHADAKEGTLAYYAPWGDIVMFYKDFGSAPGLFELGHAVSGSEFIQGMSGTIRIEKAVP